MFVTRTPRLAAECLTALASFLTISYLTTDIETTCQLSQGKRCRRTSCLAIIRFSPFSHSSVAIQREQRKNQEQGNIYKDLSVRSCAESVCAQCAV